MEIFSNRRTAVGRQSKVKKNSSERMTRPNKHYMLQMKASWNVYTRRLQLPGIQKYGLVPIEVYFHLISSVFNHV